MVSDMLGEVVLQSRTTTAGELQCTDMPRQLLFSIEHHST